MNIEVNIATKTELEMYTTAKGDTVYAVVFDTGQFAHINQANTAIHPCDIIKK